MGLKYYAGLNDAPGTDLLRQANINTKNQLMDFSGSSWQDFQALEKVQEDILFSIEVGQLTMEHIQDQLHNPVQKVSTMQHELQEWL